jgi:hypothetical protein
VSILYPRLLGQVASDLHYRYEAMTVAELSSLCDFTHPAAVFAATGGQRVSVPHLRELRKQIVDLATASGFPEIGGKRVDHGPFDRAVAHVLHERCGLVAAEAAIRPIWAFLALVVLPDVSYWRYPKPPEDRILATDITRHVWGRLWWRAHFLVMPGRQDPYRHLATFNETEFDQIYARRDLLGGSREVIRALAESWPALRRPGIPDRELLRDTLKRLLRSAAVVEFDALEGHELRDHVRDAVGASATALLKTRP